MASRFLFYQRTLLVKTTYGEGEDAPPLICQGQEMKSLTRTALLKSQQRGLTCVQVFLYIQCSHNDLHILSLGHMKRQCHMSTPCHLHRISQSYTIWQKGRSCISSLPQVVKQQLRSTCSENTHTGYPCRKIKSQRTSAFLLRRFLSLSQPSPPTRMS